jgi:hypothetical protein
MVGKLLNQISPEKLVNPYFVAVLSGKVDSEKFKKVIRKLPGVILVDEKTNDQSRRKLDRLVKDLGHQYKINSEIMDFKSVRIILNPSLSTESFEFIREQVEKLIGKDNVKTTEIKFPEVTKAMKSHAFYRYLTDVGDWGVVAVVSLFWIISYWLCYDIFRSRAYIVEKFQRRKFVAAKTLAIGLGLIYLVFTILSIWSGAFKLFDLIILFMIMSVFWTFSMQEWKWKPTI